MATQKGLWDDTLVPDGWFDETQQTVGWWDADLLDTTASGTHSATGALVGQGSTVVGAALHPHTSSGVLTGQGSAIVGSAVHNVAHSTSGALVGQSSVIVGSAAHVHATSGALVGQGSAVVGSAAHVHASTGVLTGAGAAIVGSAAHTAGGVSHDATGALVGSGAFMEGTALHVARAADGGGGYKFYKMYKRDWEEKVPPKVAQAIERVARSSKTGEEAEAALRLEVAEWDARYARMLTALQEMQLNSLKVLRQMQIAQIAREQVETEQRIKAERARREDDDMTALLMLL